jgi:anti-sigma B factor antagonist
MEIIEETRGSVVVVSASGRLDSNTAPALEAVLPARIDANPATVLSLAEVPYVSSAGLRVLLIGAKAARAKGHRLVLVGLSDSVREVFDISGFTAIFSIEPDIESALAALG